jgi:hypothetical protein
MLALTITYYDLRLIRGRQEGARGAAADLFYSAYRRQQSLARMAPFTVVNAFLQVGLILLFPVFFLQNYGHLILVTIQILAFVYLLQRTLRYFKRQRELIVAKAVEELYYEQDGE